MMKKLMTRQYNRILMQSDKQTRIDKMIIALAHYVLYPETRKRSYGKYLRWLMHGLLTYFIVMLVFDVGDFRKKLIERNNELDVAYNKVDFLVKNASKYVYNQMQDSFMMSEDYLRYNMYTETGILVPTKVSESHLQTIAEMSKLKSVPLKIYLRVIYHESRFDSTAVNSSSGAFGFCQMMPRTFNHLYDDLNLAGGRTAKNNLTVGAELLARQYRYWIKRRDKPREAWEMALACYAMGDSLPRAMNAVPSAVRPYVDYVLYKKEL